MNLLNESHAVMAEVVAPEAGAEGVILANGGLTGGICLYAKGGKLKGEVNWVEIDVDKDALDQDHFLTGEERFHVAMALQ